MPTYFHVREERLSAGALIEPGRWGSMVLAYGKLHQFFAREQLLEDFRTKETAVAVSRLSCVFAFEDRDSALTFAEAGGKAGDIVHAVTPEDPSAAPARLDMLWLTWMGEPNVTPAQVAEWCRGYWSGRAAADLKPGARECWELLFPCTLRVLASS